jgi:hypothetical protein
LPKIERKKKGKAKKRKLNNKNTWYFIVPTPVYETSPSPCSRIFDDYFIYIVSRFRYFILFPFPPSRNPQRRVLYAIAIGLA